MIDKIKKELFVVMNDETELLKRTMNALNLIQNVRLINEKIDQPVGEVGEIYSGGNFPTWKTKLCRGLCEALGMQCWSLERNGKKSLVLFGEEEIGNALIRLIEYLDLHIESMTKKHMKESFKKGKLIGNSFRLKLVSSLLNSIELIKITTPALKDKVLVLNESLRINSLPADIVNKNLFTLPEKRISGKI